MKKLLFAFLALLIAFPAFAADQWDKSIPLGTTEINDYDVVFPANFNALDRLLSNYNQGVRINYSSASAVSVSAGSIVCSNSDGTVRRFRKNAAATTVDWDDIDTGTEQASTTYYVYAVADTDIEGFTLKISASSSAPSGATNYSKIGSFYNDSDSDITRINNESDRWELGAAVSKTLGTTYQALSDGVVVATIDCSGTTAGYLTGYTDAASSPATVLSRGGCTYVAGEGLVLYDGLSFPVKSGDYYKVTVTVTGAYPNPTGTMHFIPKQ